MFKTFLAFFSLCTLGSCTQKQELPKFDNNGKLIVYSEEIYAKMWTQNQKLDVTVVDTFCVSQTKKAYLDIKKGKLKYFIPRSPEFEILSNLLRANQIETVEFYRRCARMEGFEPYCYQNIMSKEIENRYGQNYIDSITEVAKRQFVKGHPNFEYMEDGVDLRMKYARK